MIDIPRNYAGPHFWTSKEAYRPDCVELLRQRVLPPRTFRDDLADFAADLRKDPFTAAVCTILGFVAGMLAVIVPAIVMAWALS